MRDAGPGGPILMSGGIRSDQLYCWGANWGGQLGDGSETSSPTPKRIGGSIVGWESVASARGHTCGIARGKLYCWGYNNHCQVGSTRRDGPLVLTPAYVGSGYEDWHQVTAANEHSCGVASGADYFYCWGENDVAQLGVGHHRMRHVPTPVLSYDPLP